MAYLRQHLKILLVLISVSFVWMHYLMAEHEGIDHSLSDDCVICKITKNCTYTVNVTNAPKAEYNIHKDFVQHVLFSKVYFILWDKPLSRAPPVSLS